MTSPLDGFRGWCAEVTIPSSDYGDIKFCPWLGTQDYLHAEIEEGLARGIHDFTVLKGGRQIGGSTYMDALSIYYLQKHSGLVGMMVSDEDDNRDYRRDVITQMLDSLPRTHRYHTRRDNPRMLAWAPRPATGYRGSRLLFAAAGKRADSNLGRSKGLSFGYNDEVGSWYDQKAYSALRASRSKRNPLRLYVDISTARGIGTVFHDEWKTAQTAVARKAIFVPWWRHAGYSLADSQGELWERYASDPPSDDELAMMKEVHKRYGVKVTLGQLAWYRWQLEEELGGDETLRAQEFGSLPEECFQAFGDKFVEPHVVERMRRQAATAPRADGYRYDFGAYLDDLRVYPDDPGDAPLRVWEPCDPSALYVVAAHPQLSSSDRAKEFVVGVYRAYPEKLVQVAEYAADQGYMHKFGWVVLHLCAAYRTWAPPSLIMEIQGPGIAAYEEMKRIEERGWGVRAGEERNALLDAVGSIQYLFRRASSFTGTVAPHMKANQEERDRILYAMRDHLERRYVEPRSPELLDQLSGLRRGEDDDNDLVAGGGASEESRAYCLALAVEQWLKIGDLTSLLASHQPKEDEDAQPLRVENVLVREFIGGLGRK